MDVRRVLIFRSVVREGSLAAAARDLRWTQPAVSQHMRALEREVGAPLLVRGARGVVPTEAGRVLLVHADAIAARLSSAEDELASLVDLEQASVRLAAFPSACSTIVPAALKHLAERHPGVRVELTQAEPPEAVAMVEAGQVDSALVFRYAESPDVDPPHLRRHRLGTDPVAVVLPPAHRLAEHPRLRLRQLAGERWITGCERCERHLVDVCARAGFAPDVRHRTDDYVVVQSLVAAGLAVALLPALALHSVRNPDVQPRLLPDAGTRELVLVHHREAERTPALGAVSESLRAVERDFVEVGRRR